jgi:uncharacterized protein YjbI with pentapeptide repeats
LSQELVDLLAAEDVEGFNARRGERSRPELFAADLAGKKLHGVDFSNANLEKADLTGTDLGEANLMKAQAAGIDGTGARLVGAIALRVRLKDAYLDESDLSEGDFSQADLADANLDRSVAVGARFAGARLRGVSAKDARWEDAEMAEAKLHKADFSGSDLRRVDLTDASGAEMLLVNARLEGAVGTGAKLPEANLEGCNLDTARFVGASFAKARLVNASLVAADLSRANLSGADLTGADLTGANLSDACLDGANFADCTLDGADLSGVDARVLGLSDAQLASLSAHGVPFDANAPLVVRAASLAKVGERVGMTWLNPDSDETKTLRWGVSAAGRFVHGVVPVPGDTVLDAQVVAHDGRLRLIVHRTRPDGIVLEDAVLGDDGPIGRTVVPLGYDPLVHPVFRSSADGLWMWGLARRGPTLTVHRLSEDGWVLVHSENAPTARGFLAGMPILLGKGDVLTPIGPTGSGGPRRAPEGFPGTHAVAGMDGEDLVCVWSLARRGDVPGGVRHARIQKRGHPEEEMMSLSGGVTALAACHEGDEIVIAWLEAGEHGVSATVPWLCRLPNGVPFPVTDEVPDATGLRLAPGVLSLTRARGGVWLADTHGAALTTLP